MYSITCTSDPYATAIAAFIKRDFPIYTQRGDGAQLDALTDAIVASGQIRFGPKPSPEGLVAIRQIISHHVTQHTPIAFVLGWGSEKPDGSGVDIAELCALKTLACLNSRVSRHHAPGIQVSIRIEDASAPFLFFDRMEQARVEAARYTQGFIKLVRVTGSTGFVLPRPESDKVTDAVFTAAAERVLPYMEQHVRTPEDIVTRSYLTGLGWQQPLSHETIGHYLKLYDKLYPTKTLAEKQHILARYFASAMTRFTLGTTGVDPAWQGKYLELSLVPPSPGFNPQRALRRIHYRTMPSAITSNHMAPWRAKGYLRIGDEVGAGLASFNDKNVTFNPNVITLSDGQVTQDVQADYLVPE